MILLVQMILLTGCGSFSRIDSLEGNPNIDQTTLSFEQAIVELSNPEKISEYIQQNIVYKADVTEADEFRAAEITFQLGYGDCEDFSILAARFLKEHGYNSQLFMVVNSQVAHCVCIWQEGQEYSIINNGYLIADTGASDLKEVADLIYSDNIYYAVVPI